jgi:hypothetical protein
MNRSKIPTESSETRRSGEGAKSTRRSDIELNEEALNRVVGGAGTIETRKPGDIKLTEEALNKVAGAGTISARR